MFDHTIGRIWFLCSVLASSVAVTICGKFLTKNLLRLIFGTFLSIVIVAVFPNKDLNLFMYPYFIIGFLFSKNYERISKSFIKLQYLSIALFPIMLPLYTKKHYIYTSGLNILQNFDLDAVRVDVFRWTIGLVGSIFIITVAQILFCFKYKLKSILPIYNHFEAMGSKSLQLYCLQRTFLECWLPILFGIILDFLPKNNIHTNMIVYNSILTPFIAVVYSIVLLKIIKLLEKFKITRILFGR